jgi:hypothetical protein
VAEPRLRNGVPVAEPGGSRCATMNRFAFFHQSYFDTALGHGGQSWRVMAAEGI